MILENATLIAFIIRGLALAVVAIFIIPLMWRETKVKNGLRVMRYQLLAYGICHCSINTITLWFLYDILERGVKQAPINSMLQLANSVFFLAIAIIGYLIYHSNYTIEGKAAHAKVEKQLRKEAKK